MFMSFVVRFLCGQNKFQLVLSDMTTDAAVIEHEIVLRFVKDGPPKTKMAVLVNLDHVHAKGVFDSIDLALDLCM